MTSHRRAYVTRLHTKEPDRDLDIVGLAAWRSDPAKAIWNADKRGFTPKTVVTTKPPLPNPPLLREGTLVSQLESLPKLGSGCLLGAGGVSSYKPS